MSIASLSSFRRLSFYHQRFSTALCTAHGYRHTPRARAQFNFQLQQFRGLRTMDAQELAQYYADSPPAVVRLEIAKHFEPLSDKQKRYAHFISR